MSRDIMRMYSFSEYPHSKIPRAFARGILVMTAKIRHNRARGSHDVDLMSNIVAELTEMGKSNQWIMKHLGMDADEVIRLKQITGLAALFKDRDYSNSWD